MICLKISTFVVSTTTVINESFHASVLWFAWKYLPLWYQQQHKKIKQITMFVVICLKISTFVVSTTTETWSSWYPGELWFAWKYLPLWYQQQPSLGTKKASICCDLLENIYLCGINNNNAKIRTIFYSVVICLKISTFVVSTTTMRRRFSNGLPLWFAWKYLPLWYQQQLMKVIN